MQYAIAIVFVFSAYAVLRFKAHMRIRKQNGARREEAVRRSYPPFSNTSGV